MSAIFIRNIFLMRRMFNEAQRMTVGLHTSRQCEYLCNKVFVFFNTVTVFSSSNFFDISWCKEWSLFRLRSTHSICKLQQAYVHAYRGYQCTRTTSILLALNVRLSQKRLWRICRQGFEALESGRRLLILWSNLIAPIFGVKEHPKK
jgi:hypothetical protein